MFLFFYRPRSGLFQSFVSVALGLMALAGLTGMVMACQKDEAPPLIEKTSGRRVFFHTKFPASYILRPAVAPSLKTLQTFVESDHPVMAINGGFFDPKNGKTTSYVSTDGIHWLDPKENERLMENKSLAPYLEKVLNRSEFREYQCGGGKTYDIVPHNTLTPEGCRLVFALGAGPKLAPELSSEVEGFMDFDSQGNIIRDPVGMHRPYARSAIGITAKGEVILGMGGFYPGARTSSIPKIKSSIGFSLPEIAELMKEAGAVKVLALDGGGSSGFYHSSRFLYGKYTKEGKPEKRLLKSVLMVFPPQK